MKNYNIGKILANAEMGKKDTIFAKNSYRVVEVTGGWEIYSCPTDQVGREWIDCEGNHLTAWRLHSFISLEMRRKCLQEYREHLISIGKEQSSYPVFAYLTR